MFFDSEFSVWLVFCCVESSRSYDSVSFSSSSVTEFDEFRVIELCSRVGFFCWVYCLLICSISLCQVLKVVGCCLNNLESWV